MSNYIKISVFAIWMLLLAFWIVTGFKAKKKQASEGKLKNFLYYWLPILVASFLLGPGPWFGSSWYRENFIEHTDTVGIWGLALCVAGAIICCWARWVLGNNWSLSVQQKTNHELITHGPYSLVRHPIYTGLLLLFSGNALIVGDYRAILAVLIVFVSFLFKIKKEEQLLKEIFPQSYPIYRRKTKALIPYIL